LRLAGALWKFWHIRGHGAEGAEWLERLLREGEEAAPGIRSRALGVAGALAFQRADYPRARTLFQEQLTLEETAGNLKAIAATLGNLANIASSLNDPAGAHALLEQSLAHFRDLNDARNIALALGNLVIIADMENDLTQALSYNQESIEIFRRLQDDPL